MKKVLVFGSNAEYQRVRGNETHKIATATHVFVKSATETFVGVKGPYSGREVTARTIERLRDGQGT